MDEEEKKKAEQREQERARAMKDLWENTLSEIPTTFGKMVYLAALRSENSGSYQHFGLAQLYSPEGSDLVLRSSHEQVFGDWLTYTLEQQRQDLERYLESIEDDKGTVVETWLTLGPYRQLIPAAASEAEKQLYISDLELILDVLRNEFSPSP